MDDHAYQDFEQCFEGSISDFMQALREATVRFVVNRNVETIETLGGIRQACHNMEEAEICTDVVPASSFRAFFKISKPELERLHTFSRGTVSMLDADSLFATLGRKGISAGGFRI